MAQDRPKVPTGTRAAGRALWDAVLGPYDLEQHELALLIEAVRTVDLLDALDATIRRDGVLHDSPQGLRAHPAVVEVRQQRIALARLLAALRLPAGAEGDEQASARQPQRRGAPRGIYSIRGSA
jgi:hypothetical protein